MAFTLPDPATLPRFVNIIGDQREEAGSGQRIAHVYPGTGTVTRELAMASAADVDRAVAAARAAFPAWRAMPGDKRRNLFFRLAEMLEARSGEFAPGLIAENGSVAMTAPYMGYDAAQKLRYFGGWADKIHGRTVPMWGAPAHDYVAYEPYGKVGIIVPWNGPLFAATMVLAPALAAGNCVVLKSPDLAPYSVMKLVEMMLEAGFPAGVVNLVTGGADVGEAMVAHPGIDKIEFIGSGATATKVLTSAARSLKPVGLELGGKSAVIVIDEWTEQTGKAELACPACKKKSSFTQWNSYPALGFGNLSFIFWNWPAFELAQWKFDIPGVVAEVTGHKIVRTSGRL